jgi:hypothetical protein
MEHPEITANRTIGEAPLIGRFADQDLAEQIFKTRQSRDECEKNDA